MVGVSNWATKEIRAELDAIAARDGILRAEAVVDASRDPKSAMHSLFLWDDPDRAAHLGRLEIARQLIIRVKVDPFEAAELHCSPTIRKYHGRLGGGYYDMRSVVTKTELRERLLMAALEELQRLLLKYESLEQLGPVRSAVDRIAKSVKSRAKRKGVA